MTGDNGMSDRSPLVSPHVEDEYSEIFRNFTKGLKVPAVPFLEFSTDFGGGIAEISDDSYSDIFGGFGWDVAVSLEELLGGLMVGAGKKDAEKKARWDGTKKSLENIPSGLHSFSAEQKVSSEIISVASSSAFEELHDEERLFPWSCKTKDPPGRENFIDRIHNPEVDSVDRHISAIDANMCYSENYKSDTRDAIAYSISTLSDASEEVNEIKAAATFFNDSSSSTYLPHMHGNDEKQDSANTDTHHVESAPTCISSHSSAPFHEHGTNQSDSSEVFLTVAEINLQTQPTQVPPPSRPPPKLDVRRDAKTGSSTNNWTKKHSLHSLANNNSGHHRMTSSETHVVEGALKPCVFPCLDVEMDANSAASASTAAMKDVMDKSKTKTKIAKESKERRRDILDNQKVLEAKDGRIGMERKKNEAGQDFYTLTPKMAPMEMKFYGQENGQAKTNAPMEALDLHQERRSFYIANGYEEKNFKGSSAVKGFDWQKMKIPPDNGVQEEEHEGMIPAEENFVLQEDYLAHNYKVKLLGERLNGVTESNMWGMDKKEYKLDEAQKCDIKEKTLNPAAVAYERKESGNKLMTVQKIQPEEENFLKRKADELYKRAGQDIQQQGEKEKKKFPRQWTTNKEMQTVAAACGTNAHKLRTVEEFGKQEQVQSSRQGLIRDPAEQEEMVRLIMDDKDCWHEKSDKVFEVFQDVNEATDTTRNAAKLISRQKTEDGKKGMARKVTDENSRTTEQIRYFTEAQERERKQKMWFDKERLEEQAERETDELWNLEEEMEKLWRSDEEVEDGKGMSRDSVKFATENANDKVIIEVCSSVEIAAVDKEIVKVRETANAETCKKADERQAGSRERSQEVKAVRGPVLSTVQAPRGGTPAEDWEQPVSDIIKEATAESTEFMKQTVADMVASSVGDKQKRDEEPELCNGTSLSLNSDRYSSISVSNVCAT
ncbi:unnamed protein product [Victoria cruziana]